MSSWEVYSSSMDVLASISACLFALLNAAAVPMGDFGSTPPSISERAKQTFTEQAHSVLFAEGQLQLTIHKIQF